VCSHDSSTYIRTGWTPMDPTRKATYIHGYISQNWVARHKILSYDTKFVCKQTLRENEMEWLRVWERKRLRKRERPSNENARLVLVSNLSTELVSYELTK
jgi:hypothetical protein